VNDVHAPPYSVGDTSLLALRKLELEVAEAESRQATARQKEKFERRKEKLELKRLEQDILEKKLLNDHKQKMGALEAEKAALDNQEKGRAAQHQVPPAVWEATKYVVAALPVLATVIGLYFTHRKDTEALRHQAAMAQKFSIDDQVLKLFKSLTDPKNPVEASNAAIALSAYGRVVTRIIVPSLKMHIGRSPSLVSALVDVVANEPDKGAKKQAADEIVQRIADQADLAINAMLPVPTDDVKSANVRVYLDALVQLHEQCAPACESSRAALLDQSRRIQALLDKLQPKAGPLNSQVLAAAERVKAVLASWQKGGMEIVR
jgi:protein tyrosine phosphatase (PTP) superfamily phosphohydrolase (DUF442 family)